MISKNLPHTPPSRPWGDGAIIQDLRRNPIDILVTRIVRIVLIRNVRRPNPYHVLRSRYLEPRDDVTPGGQKILDAVVLRPPRIAIGVVHLMCKPDKERLPECRCVCRPLVKIKIVRSPRNVCRPPSITDVPERQVRVVDVLEIGEPRLPRNHRERAEIPDRTDKL